MKMRYVLASGSSAAREIDMNKIKSVICFLALGAISPHAWATPNNDDIKAMLSQAKSGDASAQTQLGILYAEGSGVTRDYKKARSWFEQAGKQNYADAEYNLGVMYGNGDGVARDNKKALTWFEKAAEHGHIGARYNLGMIYGQGIGTAKDPVRAAFWFELAGQDGSPEDKYTLGVMYSKGEPLEKNDVKARQWFERAANEGHVLAQYNLAVMYSEGLGGDRDLRKARHWADKAAGQGDPEATRLLSILNERGKQSPFEILMVAGGDPAAAPHIVPPVRLGSHNDDEQTDTKSGDMPDETPVVAVMSEQRGISVEDKAGKDHVSVATDVTSETAVATEEDVKPTPETVEPEANVKSVIDTDVASEVASPDALIINGTKRIEADTLYSEQATTASPSSDIEAADMTTKNEILITPSSQSNERPRTENINESAQTEEDTAPVEHDVTIKMHEPAVKEESFVKQTNKQ